jgi:DNA topoisomerase I
MEKMNSTLKDKQVKLKDLEKWLKKFKKDKQLKIDSTDGMPKTLP